MYSQTIRSSHPAKVSKLASNHCGEEFGERTHLLSDHAIRPKLANWQASIAGELTSYRIKPLVEC